MSSCLSGGRTYGFELELIKSQTSSSNQTTIQTTSSSSSTLSESSNSPLSISTRKPRTSRKRPNQIYNEAAALLSTAYPNIFSRKHFTQNPGKFTKPRDSSFYNDQSDELLLPFRIIDDFGTPLHCHHHSSIQEKPRFQFEQKMSVEISSPDTNSLSLCNGDNGDIDDDEDLNGESSTILDEEIQEGIIDSIMGNLCVNESVSPSSCHQDISINASYGYPMPIGLAFGGIFGLHRGLRTALKPVDEGDWWRFPAVDVDQISPKYNTTNITTTAATTTNNNKVTNVVAAKKKKKKIEKPVEENEKSNSNANANSNSNANSELSEEKGIEANANSGLLLKLNFDDVLTSWSDRGSPFSDDIQASELAGADLHARLAQIDLFLENGGVREASVMRYKEKRRTRLFSKKIRYQVRKVNADTRPRMKGRFVRRPNCNASGAQR